MKVDEVVWPAPSAGGWPVNDLLAWKLQGIRITEYASFWKRESGQVDAEEISASWMLFSDGFGIGILHRSPNGPSISSLSGMLLILTLPITLSTALLIKLESKGPVFYRQERVGLHGKTVHGAQVSQHVHRCRKGWSPLGGEERLPALPGSAARSAKWRVDEIPQVINVLIGDMAFVGPRPERPVFVKALSEKILRSQRAPHHQTRHYRAGRKSTIPMAPQSMTHG